MKQSVLTIAMVLFAATSFACDGEPWIELKIIAGEMAGQQAIETTTVDVNGCVASQYANFDIRAGAYQRQLDPDQRDTLQAQLAGLLGFDVALTREQLDQPAVVAGDQDGIGPTLFHVAGGDTYQLVLHGGQARKEISWHAPLETARVRTDVTALVDLAQFFATLRDVAADPRKADVQKLIR